MKSLVTIKDYTLKLPLAEDNAVAFLDSAFSPFNYGSLNLLKLLLLGKEWENNIFYDHIIQKR